MKKQQTRSIYQARTDFLKALAHPGRLMIVDLLAEGEMCVCELAAATGYDVSTVSRHLSQMKRVAIVDSRREGTTIWYRLQLSCISDLFRCVETGVADRLVREKQLCSCTKPSVK